MISDWKCTETDWFIEAYSRFAHTLHGSAQVAERVTVAYEFQENPWMMLPDFWEKDKAPDVKPMKGVYRGGASVVGCALHRCYWENETPILVGVDMDGDNALVGRVYKPGHWDQKIELLNALFGKYLPQTRTLTETKLNLEVTK